MGALEKGATFQGAYQDLKVLTLWTSNSYGHYIDKKKVWSRVIGGQGEQVKGVPLGSDSSSLGELIN